MLHLTIRTITDISVDDHRLVHEWRDIAGIACAFGYVGGGARWMRWPGFAIYRFDGDGQVEAFPERQVEPSRILDLFRRTVEPLVLQALGWETLHASSVLMPRGVVGFCGDCESGKSTIAYSLGRRGYRQKGDDSLVLCVGSQGIRTLDLPFGVRLRPESAAFFGFTPDGRQLQDVVPIAGDDAGRVSTHPLAALFVLSRKPSGDPTIEQLDPAAAFRALLGHARSFDSESPADRRRLIEDYLTIAGAVPVYALQFAAGLEQLPSVLQWIERTVEPVLVESV